MDPTAMMNPMGFGPGMVGGMGPGFGAGPRGPGFAMEKVFPVVRLRGLPFNAVEFDILEFFQGLDPVDVLIVRRDGRTTGEAYVLFANPMQVRVATAPIVALLALGHQISPKKARRDGTYTVWEDSILVQSSWSAQKKNDFLPRAADPFPPSLPQMDFALQKNRGPMGRRYIEVFRSKKQDYYHAVAQAVSEPAPPDGFYGGGDGSGAPLPHSGAGAPPLPHGGLPGAGARAQQEHTGVLKMRGLPFSSTKDDIAGFFDDPNLSGVAPLSHDAIHIVTSLDGRPSGVAFVEFASAEEAKAAMIRDRQSMGTRYVELFPSSREEATRAATGGR